MFVWVIVWVLFMNVGDVFIMVVFGVKVCIYGLMFENRVMDCVDGFSVLIDMSGVFVFVGRLLFEFGYGYRDVGKVGWLIVLLLVE